MLQVFVWVVSAAIYRLPVMVLELPVNTLCLKAIMS